MRWNSTVRFPVEVQFEDIDGGGVVHHPNYLKYLERARCQAMREIGVPFGECLQEGIAFVVAEVHAKYLQPLSLAAECVVETRLVAARKSSLKILQKIVSPERPAEMSGSESDFLKTDKKTYFIAQLRLVAVDLKSGKAISLPEKLRRAGGLPQIEVLAKDPVLSDVRLAPFSEG